MHYSSNVKYTGLQTVSKLIGAAWLTRASSTVSESGPTVSRCICASANPPPQFEIDHFSLQFSILANLCSRLMRPVAMFRQSSCFFPCPPDPRALLGHSTDHTRVHE